MRVQSLPGLMTVAFGLLVQTGCSQDEGPNPGVVEGGGSVSIATAPLTIPPQYGPVANANYWAVVEYQDSNSTWQFLTAIGAEDIDGKVGVQAGAWPPGCTGDGCYVADGADGFKRADGSLYPRGAAQLVVPCVVSEELLYDPDYVNQDGSLGAQCIGPKMPGFELVGEIAGKDGKPCEPTLGMGVNQITVGVTGIDVNHPNTQELVEISEVDTGFQYPSPITHQVVCIERQDVLVPFLFDILRRAVQGTADITIDIRDMFCSMKYDCPDYGLVADENGERAKSVVTAIACTPGEEADGVSITYNYNLKCYADGEVVVDMSGDKQSMQSLFERVEKQVGLETMDAPKATTGIIAEEYSGVESIANKIYTNVAYGFPLSVLEDKKPSHCELTAIAIPQELVAPEPTDTCDTVAGECRLTVDTDGNPVACDEDADCATWKPVVNTNQHAVVWNIEVSWPELECSEGQLPCKDRGDFECVVDADTKDQECVGAPTTCADSWPVCHPVMQGFDGSCQAVGGNVCEGTADDCTTDDDCDPGVKCVPYKECTTGPKDGTPCPNGAVDCEVPAKMECVAGGTCDFDKYCVDSTTHAIGASCTANTDCSAAETCFAPKLYCPGVSSGPQTVCDSAVGCSDGNGGTVPCEEFKGACSNAATTSCSDDTECGKCANGSATNIQLCDTDGPNTCPELGHCGLELEGICDPSKPADQTGCVKEWLCPDGSACVVGEDCGPSTEEGTCQTCEPAEDIYCDDPQQACNPQVQQYAGSCQPDNAADPLTDYHCKLGPKTGDPCHPDNPDNGDSDCAVPVVVACAAPAAGACDTATAPPTVCSLNLSKACGGSVTCDAGEGTCVPKGVCADSGFTCGDASDCDTTTSEACVPVGFCSNFSDAECTADSDCGTCAFDNTALDVQCDAAPGAVNTCEVGKCGDPLAPTCNPNGENTCGNVWQCPDGKACNADNWVVATVSFSRGAGNTVLGTTTVNHDLTNDDLVKIVAAGSLLDGLSGKVVWKDALNFEIDGLKWPSLNGTPITSPVSGTVATRDLCQASICDEVSVGGEKKSCDPTHANSCREATCQGPNGEAGADCTDKLAANGEAPVGACGSMGGFCGDPKDGIECDPDATDENGELINTCPVVALCPDGKTPCDPTATGPVCGFDYGGTMQCAPAKSFDMLNPGTGTEQKATLDGAMTIQEGTFVTNGPKPVDSADGVDRDYMLGYFIPNRSFPTVTGGAAGYCDALVGQAISLRAEHLELFQWIPAEELRIAESEEAMRQYLSDSYNLWGVAFTNISRVHELFNQPYALVPEYNSDKYNEAVDLIAASRAILEGEVETPIWIDAQVAYDSLKVAVQEIHDDLIFGKGYPVTLGAKILDQYAPTLREYRLAMYDDQQESLIKRYAELDSAREKIVQVQSALETVAPRAEACEEGGLLTNECMAAVPVYSYWTKLAIDKPLEMLRPIAVCGRSRELYFGDLEGFGDACFVAPKAESESPTAVGQFAGWGRDHLGRAGQGRFGLSFGFGLGNFPSIFSKGIKQQEGLAYLADKSSFEVLDGGSSIHSALSTKREGPSYTLPRAVTDSELRSALKKAHAIRHPMVEVFPDTGALDCAISPQLTRGEDGFVAKRVYEDPYFINDFQYKGAARPLERLALWTSAAFEDAWSGQEILVALWFEEANTGLAQYVGSFPVVQDQLNGGFFLDFTEDGTTEGIILAGGRYNAVLVGDPKLDGVLNLTNRFAAAFNVFARDERGTSLTIATQINKPTKLDILQYCRPDESNMLIGLISKMQDPNAVSRFDAADVVGVLVFQTAGDMIPRATNRSEGEFDKNGCRANFTGTILSLGKYTEKQAEEEIRKFTEDLVALKNCTSDTCKAFYKARLEDFRRLLDETVDDGIPEGLYKVTIVDVARWNIEKDGWKYDPVNIFTTQLFSLQSPAKAQEEAEKTEALIRQMATE